MALVFCCSFAFPAAAGYSDIGATSSVTAPIAAPIAALTTAPITAPAAAVSAAAVSAAAVPAAASAAAVPAAASPTASTVFLNGAPIAFDAYNINANNYFKLRDIAYALNGTEKQFAVGWDDKSNSISLISGQPYIIVGGEMEGKGTGIKKPAPTDSKILLDGAEKSFTAYNIDGNNYFKLRDIGAAFNFGIDWDESNDAIVIDTSKGYSEPAQAAPQTAPQTPAHTAAGAATNADSIYSQLKNTVALPEMFAVPSDAIPGFYAIFPEQYSDAVFMMCADSLKADEIVIIRAVDANAAKAINGLLEQRLTDKAEAASVYSPEQYAIIKNCSVIQEGLWVSMIVSPDVNELTAVFKKASAGKYVPDADSGYYNSFFDDAVFIGDSITQGLEIYVLSQRSRGVKPLGSARFLTAVSYSINSAAEEDYLNNQINFSWQGQKYSMYDALAAMGAKELYVMLGVNDEVGSDLVYYRDLYIKAMEKVVGRNPGILIRIESCTPVTKEHETSTLNNEATDKFNEMLYEICKASGYDYVDISSGMKREDNSLRPEYSSDQIVHMNNDGCVAWINALYAFARQKYIEGEWAAAGEAPEAYPGIWL